MRSLMWLERARAAPNIREALGALSPVDVSRAVRHVDDKLVCVAGHWLNTTVHRATGQPNQSPRPTLSFGRRPRHPPSLTPGSGPVTTLKAIVPQSTSALRPPTSHQSTRHLTKAGACPRRLAHRRGAPFIRRTCGGETLRGDRHGPPLACRRRLPCRGAHRSTSCIRRRRRSTHPGAAPASTRTPARDPARSRRRRGTRRLSRTMARLPYGLPP